MTAVPVGSVRPETGAQCSGQSATTTIVVLIPAHNEAAAIAAAVGSLRQQSRQPDMIMVVADNCTDDTAMLAAGAGARVIRTVDNDHKKAGALNQALELIMPTLIETDAVLIMDADTTIAPDFIEVALQTLAADPRAGGVSSVFVGRRTGNLIGEFQRMEYQRYRREIRRRNHQAFVMSGTASLFRVAALHAVRAARDGVRLPAGDGYYDVYSLTEDNELRPVSPYAASKIAADYLALQAHLGYRLAVMRVRAFNHLGPGQTNRFVAPALAERIALNELEGGEVVPVGNLTPRRDFTDVRDVVRAYRMLIEAGEPGQAYNVCSGVDVSVEEIAHRLLDLAGADLTLEVDPALKRPVDIPVLRGDNGRIREATGWTPSYSLDDTLRDVLHSYLQ